MKLFSRVLGDGNPPLIVLHGLFGMSDNWLSLGKRWAENRKVYLLDQRNHGLSPQSDEWTYEVMAEDVRDFMLEEGLPSAHILGHSMGGKTAMCLAASNPQLVRSLVVVDIGPKQYPVHHRSIINALLATPVDALEKRSEVEEWLSKGIPQAGVRQFLMKSLHRCKDGGFEWRFNLPVIDREIENVGQALPDDWGYDGPSFFIRGEESGYILDEDLPAIHRQFPMMQFEGIAKAGHWVHAEQPDALYGSVQQFISAND